MISGISRPENLPQAQLVGSTTWRLTGRGRVLVVVLAVVLVATAWWAINAGRAQADSAPRPPCQVRVQPGQTLWGVAGQVSPQEDPRVVIQRLMQVNHLHSAMVQAGQRLQC